MLLDDEDMLAAIRTLSAGAENAQVYRGNSDELIRLIETFTTALPAGYLRLHFNYENVTATDRLKERLRSTPNAAVEVATNRMGEMVVVTDENRESLNRAGYQITHKPYNKPGEFKRYITKDGKEGSEPILDADLVWATIGKPLWDFLETYHKEQTELRTKTLYARLSPANEEGHPIRLSEEEKFKIIQSLINDWMDEAIAAFGDKKIYGKTPIPKAKMGANGQWIELTQSERRMAMRADLINRYEKSVSKRKARLNDAVDKKVPIKRAETLMAQSFEVADDEDTNLPEFESVEPEDLQAGGYGRIPWAIAVVKDGQFLVSHRFPTYAEAATVEERTIERAGKEGEDAALLVSIQIINDPEGLMGDENNVGEVSSLTDGITSQLNFESSSVESDELGDLF